MAKPPYTEAIIRALTWIFHRNQSGVVDQYGRLVAGGDCAKHIDASTWLRCLAMGFIEGNNDRIWITKAGASVVKQCGKHTPEHADG